MYRRDFMKMTVVVSAGLLPCISACNISSKMLTLRNRRPNIILILTDDQGYGDLGCLGNPILKTPNLDKLHARSTRLTCFQVSPTCAPTRSSLMTGRHEFKNGVTHTILERERLCLDATTLALMLQQSGYATGIFGKWHLGDEDAYQPQRRGFDEVFIHGGGGIGQKYPGSCADVPHNQPHRYFDPVIRHNGDFVQTEGFCTDVFFRQAMGWIHSRRHPDQPFFAYIATNAPHSPYIAPEACCKPFLDQGLTSDLAGFYGMIVNIDENVGILMNKLEQWDLEENTLILFMTDNGTALGDKVYNAGMKGKKCTSDEGGTRVPAFFCWKNHLSAGVDIAALTAQIDIFPTFAELAGAPLPPHDQVEGRSLLPLLQNPQSKWEDRFLFMHVGRWNTSREIKDFKYKGCAVRSSRFRFVNNSELYDMAVDPGQTQNVIDLHPEVVDSMRAAYEVWWKQVCSQMVNEEASYSGQAPFEEAYERQLKSTGIPAWMPFVID